MITRLQGTLERLEPQAATVAVGEGSIAYQVLVPAYLAVALAQDVGKRVVLHTLEYFESPNQGATFTPRLVGFRTEVERRFFELFTTVKGIGNRKALRALAVEPAEIAAAIAGRDTKGLTALPEIGSRLAETIIAELHGKVTPFLGEGERRALDQQAQGKGAGGDPVSLDTVAALMALGETRGDAEVMVSAASAKVSARGGRLMTVEDLLPLALAARGG